MDDLTHYMFHSPHLRECSTLTMIVLRYVVWRPDYKDGCYIPRRRSKTRTLTNSPEYMRKRLDRGDV